MSPNNCSPLRMSGAGLKSNTSTLTVWKGRASRDKQVFANLDGSSGDFHLLGNFSDGMSLSQPTNDLSVDDWLDEVHRVF